MSDEYESGGCLNYKLSRDGPIIIELKIESEETKQRIENYLRSHCLCLDGFMNQVLEHLENCDCFWCGS